MLFCKERRGAAGLRRGCHFYKLQLEGFADTVLHGAPQHGATADDGTHVLRALTAVSKACRTGERVVLADISQEIV
jgi:predicted dehydrogenase